MKMIPACDTSPSLTQKVSIAALALYFASRDVGSSNALRTVFCSE
jgi:hypothetical protein